MAFVHLHNHSIFSLLDGAAKIKDMAKRCKELGMDACAITDHGVMYGVIDFYEACKEVGIKPIIGCEVYVAPHGRFDKTNRGNGKRDICNHLILLAENQQGYKNLCKLVSLAYLEGFYYKPRVDEELLMQYHEGLICLSACIAGELPELLLDGRKEEAYALARRYSEIFGPDHYYIELQDHAIDEERQVMPMLQQLAADLNLPMVVTNDAHYVSADDAEMHDILLCIQTGKLREDPNRMRFANNSFYLKSEEEMRSLFPQLPEAYENTVKIAERCTVEFKFGDHYFPEYKVPPGFTISTYLRHLCEEGLKRRYDPVTPEIHDRLDYELSVIESQGFPGYFLLVWDMIEFARSQGIPVGPGRGSAAGSVVAYSLGITDIDPLKYDLLFERFLNPERVTPPDIDTDISDERRGEVVDYLFNHYGYDKVSQIITFNFMKTKQALQDVGRVLDMSFAEVQEISKLIPDDPSVKSLADALALSADLRARRDSDPRARELLKIAGQIEGMPRHCGKHAAGVVIAREELINYMPVQKTSDGIVVTQFAKEQVERCGLVKMDVLGLRTLSVISDCLENIEHSHGIKVDIDNVPLDDADTYAMLARGESSGVFQLESEGMRKILIDLRPERIEDIIALVALYRPGPLGSGMVDDFIASKHGEKEVEYLHPILESILKDTYGMILYQEQVMQIAQAVGGFSLGAADMLRRAMGKKKAEIIDKAKNDFVSGCLNNGVDKDIAERLFELLRYFSGYGFNKSHSAAYAIVSYRTAWLKCKYGPEFMAAMMTSYLNSTEKISEYIAAAKEMGIEILPPNINRSKLKFSVDEGRIRYALAGVKNVGREVVDQLVHEREKGGEFKSLSDFCNRVPLNRKMLESLIKCGALDCLNENRATLLASMERALEVAKKVNAEAGDMQMSLFDFGLAQEMHHPEVELIRMPEVSFRDKLDMELETIGFYVSGHPFDPYAKYLAKKYPQRIGKMVEYGDGAKVTFAGIMSACQNRFTKSGQQMGSFTLQDITGDVRCLLFPQSYTKWRDKMLPGHAAVVEGRLRADGTGEGSFSMVVDSIAPPPLKLYLRVPSGDDTHLLQLIEGLLRDFPGDMSPVLYFSDQQKYVPLETVGHVAPEPRMITALEDLLGKNNVVVKC
ncbi:MAG: DNA polymerase III subunit alpha [Firmicutes bacterium]|nr:DNA polymerase III subunit alpha [Bacillota bacterium]